MAKYIRQTSPYNTQIVALGIDTYLKMLLHDNFVVNLPTPQTTCLSIALFMMVAEATSMAAMKGYGRSNCIVIALTRSWRMTCHDGYIRHLAGVWKCKLLRTRPMVVNLVCSTPTCTRATSWCVCGPAGQPRRARRMRWPTSMMCCCGPSQRGRLAPSSSW